MATQLGEVYDVSQGNIAAVCTLWDDFGVITVSQDRWDTHLVTADQILMVILDRFGFGSKDQLVNTGHQFAIFSMPHALHSMVSFSTPSPFDIQ